MAFNRNQLTPLTRGGARTVHVGKGSRQAPMTNRRAVTSPLQAQQGAAGAFGPAPTLNNYAKATPVANPAPAAPPPDLGTGAIPGIG